MLKRVLGLIVSLAVAVGGAVSPVSAASAAPLGTATAAEQGGPSPFGRSISGTIRAAASTSQPGPIRSAKVEFFTPGGELVDWVFTDERGQFRVGALQVGSYTVLVSSSWAPTYYGNAPRWSGAAFFPVGSDQEVTGIDVTVAPGASISGTVTGTGASTAEAPSGVTAVARLIGQADPGMSGQQETAVRPDGTYTIANLAPGSYNVGFAPRRGNEDFGVGLWWSSKVRQETAGVIALAVRQKRTGINQALPSGGTISGTLVDSEGQPTWGSIVVYDATATADSSASIVTVVEARGDFTIWGLPKGRYKLGANDAAKPGLSALGMTDLAGNPLPTMRGAVPAVAVVGDWATTPAGALRQSGWPYISTWYSTADTFATGTSITVSTVGQHVSGIRAVLRLEPAFMALSPAERRGAAGATSPRSPSPDPAPIRSTPRPGSSRRTSSTCPSPARDRRSESPAATPPPSRRRTAPSGTAVRPTSVRRWPSSTASMRTTPRRAHRPGRK